MPAQAMKHSGKSPGADALWAIWHGLQLMLNRGLFVKLGLVAMLHGITSSGMWEVLQQYLQLRLGFTTLDQVILVQTGLTETVHLDWGDRSHRKNSSGLGWVSPRQLKVRIAETLLGLQQYLRSPRPHHLGPR